jgi:hypothetical protein
MSNFKICGCNCWVRAAMVERTTVEIVLVAVTNSAGIKVYIAPVIMRKTNVDFVVAKSAIGLIAIAEYAISKSAAAAYINVA